MSSGEIPGVFSKVHKENSCIFGIVSAAEIRLITVRVSAAAPNLGFLTIS
jgi:hypothetical protein